MAIDYIIEYDCAPKRALTADGIRERLKERARADEVIEWFRAAGDMREPSLRWVSNSVTAGPATPATSN